MPELVPHTSVCGRITLWPDLDLALHRTLSLGGTECELEEKKETCSVAVGNCSFCCLQVIPATSLVTKHPDTSGLEHPLSAPSRSCLGLSKGQTFCKVFTTFVSLIVSLRFYLLSPLHWLQVKKKKQHIFFCKHHCRQEGK